MMRRRLLCGLGSLALAFGAPAPQAWAGEPPAVVHLFTAVEADGRTVTLGDVARIEADDAAIRESLQDVSICFAPVAGATRAIDRDYIVLKLRQQGIEPDAIELAGAPAVHISATSTRIPAERIRVAVEQALREAMPWTDDEAQITAPRSIRDVTVPARDPVLRVEFEPGEAFYGSTVARVRAYGDDELLDTLTYRFHVAVYREVYVPRSGLPRGTVLTATDLRTERQDVTRLGDDYITDPDRLVGQRTTRSLRPGLPITSQMIEAPPVVARGDRVRVDVSGDQFLVSMTGRALEAGSVGSIIRVELPTDRRILAQVSGPGEAVMME